VFKEVLDRDNVLDYLEQMRDDLENEGRPKTRRYAEPPTEQQLDPADRELLLTELAEAQTQPVAAA
jgi:hypothetical protein